MPRIRMVKPEFFDDPEIGELNCATRLLFIGLWIHADREGRLVDEPRRLKARVFPYDKVDVGAMLDTLAKSGFIVRYDSEGTAAIQVVNFLRHQIPGRDEGPSELLAPDGSASKDIGRNPNGTVRARIYARDNYICSYCRRNMHQDARARCIDHVIPLACGGTHFDFNLTTSCKQCNSKKGAKNPDEIGFPWPEHTPRPPVNGVLTECQTTLTLKGLDRDTVSGILDTGIGKGDSCSAAQAPTLPSVAFLEFPVIGPGQSSWPLSEAQVAEWVALFPGLDVHGESRKALAWMHANTGRRKTAKGMPRFLVSWLSRAVDSGRGQRQVQGAIGLVGSAWPKWKCPHEPECLGRHACYIKAGIEDARERKIGSA